MSFQQQIFFDLNPRLEIVVVQPPHELYQSQNTKLILDLLDGLVEEAYLNLSRYENHVRVNHLTGEVNIYRLKLVVIPAQLGLLEQRICARGLAMRVDPPATYNVFKTVFVGLNPAEVYRSGKT